jgi:hypothetical protein
LFNVSVPFLLYSVPSLMWSVSCLPSSFICPLTPINCHSVPFSVAPLFLSIVLLFPDLFSSSLVLCHLSFKRARMQGFLSKINVYTFSPCSRWLARSWHVWLVTKLSEWFDDHSKELR